MTKQEVYDKIAKMRKQYADDDEFIVRLVSFIALNDLDDNNEAISTMLDLAVEYNDNITSAEQKQRIKLAITYLLDALSNNWLTIDVNHT